MIICWSPVAKLSTSRRVPSETCCHTIWLAWLSIINPSILVMLSAAHSWVVLAAAESTNTDASRHGELALRLENGTPGVLSLSFWTGSWRHKPTECRKMADSQLRLATAMNMSVSTDLLAPCHQRWTKLCKKQFSRGPIKGSLMSVSSSRRHIEPTIWSNWF